MAALKDGCLPAGAQRRIACKNRNWGQVAGKQINELEDKLRGEIKQQIDPAFGVTKTDVQFYVKEEAGSKTAMLDPLVSRPKCFCAPLCWRGKLGSVALHMYTPACSQGLQGLLYCLGSGSDRITWEKGQTGPQNFQGCSVKSHLCAWTLLLLSRGETVMFSDMFLRREKCFLT